MAQVTHKMVVIPSAGPIFPKGGINGPIVSPYKEDVRTIGILLMRGYKVTEVLPGDVRVELNLTNFDQDNEAGDEKASQEQAARQAEEARRLAEEQAAREAEEARHLAEEQVAAEAAAQKVEVKVEKPQQQKHHSKNHNKPQPQADKVESK